MKHQTLALFCNIIFVAASYKVAICQAIYNDEYICYENPNNVIVANPYDCHSFYVCQHGNAMKVICPNGSIFNHRLGNCDPNYAVCLEEEDELTVITDEKEILSEDIFFERDEIDDNTSTTSTETYNSTQFPTTTTEPYNSTQFPTTTTNIDSSLDATSTPYSTSTTEDPDSCDTCPKPIPPNSNYILCPSNDTEDPSFLPSDTFCDSFYLCYHGRPFEMFCPIGFFWNQEQKQCISERQSNCTDSSVGIKVPQCPPIGQHFFPHSEKCDCFYYCENGIRSIQQCVAFKQWDIIEHRCILDINARCIKAIPRSQRSKYYTL